MKKRGLLIFIFLIFIIPFVFATCECEDMDGDGYGAYGCINCEFEGVDCDDYDMNTYPGAPINYTDGIDNNCDGVIFYDEESCIGVWDPNTETCCGDGICHPGSDETSCPEDCGNGEGGEESSICGDGVCDDDESSETCPVDCEESFFCGDGVCDDDENEVSCPEDCEESSFCGDGVCDDDENEVSCPEDCTEEAFCGDGVCDVDEDFETCPEDCSGFYGKGMCPSEECINQNYCIQGERCVSGYYCLDGYCVYPGESEMLCEGDIFNGDWRKGIGYETCLIGEDEIVGEVKVCLDEYTVQESAEFAGDKNCLGGTYCTSVDGLNYCAPPDFSQEHCELEVVGGTWNSDEKRCYGFCGDRVCQDEEDEFSCPEDCLKSCYIDSIDWLDEEGEVIDFSYSGETVKLFANIENYAGDVLDCNGEILKFQISSLEIDADENGDLFLVNDPELLETIETVVENGVAEIEWEVVFIPDEVSDPFTGINPDYLLNAALYDGDEIYNTSEPMDYFLIVYETEEETNGGNTSSSGDPEDEESSSDENQDKKFKPKLPQSKSSSISTRPTLTTSESKKSTCGDGVCDEDENFESCPEDCDPEGVGLAGILFFILFVLIILGMGGFVYFKRWRKKKIEKEQLESANVLKKKSQSQQSNQSSQSQQPNQSSQPQQSNQSSQLQQPNQPNVQPPKLESPFSNSKQLNQTINYIKSVKAKGISDEVIKQKLRQNNYTEKQINYAFANLN